MRSSAPAFALAVASFAAPARADDGPYAWSDKVTTTPIVVQDGFGPGGLKLAGDGLEYCVPTSTTMSLLWLGTNGFTQIAPAAATKADELNLVRVMAGLMSTAANGGTYDADKEAGIRTYLRARGIASSAFTYSTVTAPTVAQLAALNTNQTVVQLGISWEDRKPDGVYVDSGGHGITLLGQDAAAGTVTVANPEPSAIFAVADKPANSVQTLKLVPSDGIYEGSPAGSYLMISTSQYPNPNEPANTRAVIATAYVLHVDASQRTDAGFTPATWTLADSTPINTNGGDLEVIAPLAGVGGLHKSGAGTLTLTAANTTTGKYQLSGGTVRVTAPGGTPLGSGDVFLNHGRLELAPSGGNPLALTLAGGAGKTFNFGGGGTLSLDPGTTGGLTLTLGGNTDGTTPNVVRGDRGTLVLAPTTGLADLGAGVSVLVAGTAGNAPTVTNGMVSPAVVGQRADADKSGAFLTYGAAGFVPATPTRSADLPLWLSTASTVYEVTAAEPLPANTTAAVHAVVVGPYTAGDGTNTTLKVGPQTAGSQAGVVLNGSSAGGTATPAVLAAGVVQFGAAEGLVYTNAAGGRIDGVIQGSGGLTTFGPGPLTLTAANTFTGGTVIQSGTLVAANASGSATGSGSVSVAFGATLAVGGSVAGKVDAATGATVKLLGGTLAGGLNLKAGSTLSGSGTVSGSATVAGTVQSAGVGGTVTFAGPVSFGTGGTFVWKLGSLTDTGPGVNWNTFVLTGSSASTVLDSNFVTLLDLSAVAGPNSGNAFWSVPHRWLVATYTTSPDYGTYVNAGAFEQGSFGIDWGDDTYTSQVVTYTPAAVPEPTSVMAFGGIGLAGWALRRRGVKRRAASAV